MGGKGSGTHASPHLVPYHWKPGQSGNPDGRQAGRQALETEFLRDLAESWKTGGIGALKRTMEKDPVAYVRVVASLMPRKLDPESIGGVARSEVRALITTLGALLNPPDVGEDGQGTSIPRQVERLPSLPETG